MERKITFFKKIGREIEREKETDRETKKGGQRLKRERIRLGRG